jgi:hypothetical protein
VAKSCGSGSRQLTTGKVKVASLLGTAAVESRLEGVDRRNLKFINLSTHYKPGLVLELNPSPGERGKQINQKNKADDTVICFTEVQFQRT